MGHSKDAIQVVPGEIPIAGLHTPPKCPRCGASMEARRAKRGRRDGMRFWGCPNFFRADTSKCDTTINIRPDGSYSVPGSLLFPRPRLIGAPGIDGTWDDSELDDKFDSWVKEEEKAKSRPPKLTLSTQLNVTLKGRFGDLAQQVKPLTPKSILILMDDEDIEIVKIVDKLGNGITIGQIEDAVEEAHQEATE